MYLIMKMHARHNLFSKLTFWFFIFFRQLHVSAACKTRNASHV